MLQIVEDIDQAKALAHEHHILTEFSEPAEIGSVSTTPIGQASIAFAFVIRKGGVNLSESSIRYLGGFDDTARFSISIEHDPSFTGRRGVRLVLRTASCGLNAFNYQFEQFICEFGAIAEGELSEVPILFGDRLAHGLPSPGDDGFGHNAEGSLTGRARQRP
jgi:hypothetical protein